METSNTSAFAGFALQVICRQEWVRERCLQDPQKLCSPELLLDPAISPNQVEILLIVHYTILYIFVRLYIKTMTITVGLMMRM